MRRSKREPIPEHFKSAEEAGEFWDTHDLADYWDKTQEADLTFDLRKKHFYIAVLPKIDSWVRTPETGKTAFLTP